jgi:cytochrome P450
VFNLFDPATFSRGHPHAEYDRLRAGQPVFRHPGSPKQPPFWALTRYADVQAVSLDSARFTSTRGFRLQTDNRASMDPQIARVLSRFMLAMDPPEHLKYRNLVAGGFQPAALKAVEPRIRRSVDELLDALRGRKSVEFVSEVAASVPIRTVCAILGVPEADEGKVIGWTNAVFGTDDPEFAVSLEVANRNYLEIFEYASWLMAERRREPRDDLVSAIANATIDGQSLDETTRQSYFSNLIAAGNETTRSTLAGAVWALSCHPAERDRLAGNPALINGAVNELVRFFSPVYQMMRIAKADLEIGGEQIREGERVVMLYGAANHDPAVFDDPHRLDLTRGNAARHLSFGTGAHHCLGSRLGLMQLRLILSGFLQRYPGFEVVGEPVYLFTNFVQAIKHLQVRLAA